MISRSNNARAFLLTNLQNYIFVNVPIARGRDTATRGAKTTSRWVDTCFLSSALGESLGKFFGAWPDGEIRGRRTEVERGTRTEERREELARHSHSHDPRCDATRSAAPCAERRKSCYIVPTRRAAQVLPRYPRYLLIYLIRPKRTVGPLGVWREPAHFVIKRRYGRLGAACVWRRDSTSLPPSLPLRIYFRA